MIHKEKGYDTISIKDGILTGIAQGLGVLPGISRSGITIAASRFAGIKRENAGEFSFLIAIPATIGAFGYKLKDIESIIIEPLVLVAGLLTCFLVGIGSLLLLIRLA